MAGFRRETGPKTRHKGRIWGVYVTPVKRDGGTGRSLLRQLLEQAGKIQGLEQIMLSVTETQTAAIGLYRSFGFVSFGRER
jgi:ribosomal protein S18 acetylase RimI-like enzyme